MISFTFVSNGHSKDTEWDRKHMNVMCSVYSVRLTIVYIVLSVYVSDAVCSTWPLLNNRFTVYLKYQSIYAQENKVLIYRQLVTYNRIHRLWTIWRCLCNWNINRSQQQYHRSRRPEDCQRKQENFVHLAFDCNGKMGLRFQLAIDEKYISKQCTQTFRYTCRDKVRFI